MADGNQITLVKDFTVHFAKRQADKVALKFEDLDLTYGDLEVHSNQIANGLLSHGLKSDERVGYLGKNSHAFYEILFGIAKAGGVICPVNWRLALPEMAYILNDAKIRILFLGQEYIGILDELIKKVNLKDVILIEPSQKKDLPLFDEWRDAFDKTDPEISRSPNDAFAQLYTSGTTGHPKGAILSNRSLLASFTRYDNSEPPPWNIWTENDVSLIAMPCFHIGGTAWGLTTLGNGATGVIMREFDATKILTFIDEYKISKIFLVPAAMQFVVNQPNARDIDYSQLEYMLYGASPIPLKLLQKCMDVFGCGFVQMYGMTETAGTIVALPPEDHDPNGTPRMRSAGKALEGIELAVLGTDGEHLPPGEIGEIITRSSMNMNGYWNLPKATSSTITEDGWLKTGDAGFIDKDGYLFIHDRVKDMIISGGENIYPAEVENALYSHEKIADAAVIGVPDDKWGESVKAIIVVKEGEALSEEDVITFAKTQIASFKCPKSIDFIDALPRNASGKILRKDLRKNYWGDKERAVN